MNNMITQKQLVTELKKNIVSYIDSALCFQSKEIKAKKFKNGKEV